MNVSGRLCLNRMSIRGLKYSTFLLARSPGADFLEATFTKFMMLNFHLGFLMGNTVLKLELTHCSLHLSSSRVRFLAANQRLSGQKFSNSLS